MQNLKTMREFWRGKRVLVTGHTGFKGSWLCLWLELLGADVLGYALESPTNPSLFERADVARNMTSVHGDVRDLDHLSGVTGDFAPEIILHLAAQALVRESYIDPVGTYGTNVMGTVHVLESARRAGSVRAIINVTTDKCYENPPDSPAHVETDPMGGSDPYSNSKGCSELVTWAYRRSFFADAGAVLAAARAGNVIGGGDWADDRLVPDFARAAIAGRDVVIRNPDSVRPWQYVLEPLSGYLLLAERLAGSGGRQYAEGWNFGPEQADAWPVRRIVDRAVEIWGGGASWSHDGGPNPPEAKMLRLDCAKASQRLDWRPRTNIDKALQWTVDWYRRVHEGADPRELTLQRIREFVALGCADCERPDTSPERGSEDSLNG